MVATAKPPFRIAARARRAACAGAVPDFVLRLARHAATLVIPDNAIVGGYVAMGDEADPRLLLAALAAQGCVIAYPRVSAKGEPLHFHLRPPAAAFIRSAYGVLEPATDWPRAEPAIFLVPLLAFDAVGTRLGYGGGFYDRTLAVIPGARAIGVAYAGQEVPALPQGAHDHPLDAVITENGVRGFRKAC